MSASLIAARIAELAWGIVEGRPEPFVHLLRASGFQVHEDGQTIRWTPPKHHAGVGGGIVMGADPITAVVMVLMALIGPMWPKIPEAQKAFDLVKEQWKARRKGGAS